MNVKSCFFLAISGHHQVTNHLYRETTSYKLLLTYVNEVTCEDVNIKANS